MSEDTKLIQGSETLQYKDQKRSELQHWWETTYAQEVVAKVRAGDMEALKSLSLKLASQNTLYKMPDGTVFDTSEWIKEHLDAFHAANSSHDAKLMLRQVAAIVGHEDLLLDLQYETETGTALYTGKHDFEVHPDTEIIEAVTSRWSQDTLRAFDPDRIAQGKGEKNVLTKKWLGMSTQERIDYLKNKYAPKEEGAEEEDEA